MARIRREIKLQLDDALASVKKETAMNFTGGNTFPSIGRRLNWQIAAAAGGLALLTAGALSGLLQRDDAPSAPSTARPAQPPAVGAPARTAAQPSEHVYLVVGSQAAAAELRSVISADAATNEELANALSMTEVVVIEDRAQEDSFNAQLAVSSGELMAYGISQNVIDLRAPASPSFGDSIAAEPVETIVYIVGSHSEKLVLEQQFHESSAHAIDNQSRQVIVLDRTGTDAQYQTLVGEQTALGNSVVDLR
jgi:hypothetical protein